MCSARSVRGSWLPNTGRSPTVQERLAWLADGRRESPGVISRPSARVTARSAAFSSSRTLPAVVADQKHLRALVEAKHRLAQLAGVLLAEVIREERDVLAPLAQRPELDVEYVEPVVEVLAEGAVLKRLLHVAVGGRSRARPRIDSLAPTRRISPFWSARRSFTWTESGISATSSKKICPGRRAPSADAIGRGARERSTDVAEELALESDSDRRGIHGDKALGAPSGDGSRPHHPFPSALPVMRTGSRWARSFLDRKDPLHGGLCPIMFLVIEPSLGSTAGPSLTPSAGVFSSPPSGSAARDWASTTPMLLLWGVPMCLLVGVRVLPGAPRPGKAQLRRRRGSPPFPRLLRWAPRAHRSHRCASVDSRAFESRRRARRGVDPPTSPALSDASNGDAR